MTCKIGTWDLLHALLTPADVDRVLQVPFLNCGEEDKQIWHFTSNGSYSVKSGYRLFCDKLAPTLHLHVDGDWNAIWSLRGAPRVKACLRRACRNVLPTRTSCLQRKGVQCPSICSLHCPNEMENCFHLFITCPKAEECWRQLNLWGVMEPMLLQIDGFRDLCFRMLASCTDDQRNLFAVTIWKCRNELLWQQKDTTPTQIVLRARSFVREWSFYNHKPDRVAQTHNEVLHRWKKPPLGFVKVNVDAGWV